MPPTPLEPASSTTAGPVLPPANAETVKFLCDVGMKRHDLAERSYDALNTRLAALFAFNSFLLPASIGSIRAAVTVTKGVPVPPIHGYWKLAILSVWCVSLLLVGTACAVGYIARQVKSLPNPVNLYRDFAENSVAEVGEHFLVSLNRAWDGNRDVVTFKARCLNVALLGILVEVVLLLITVLISL